VTGLNGPRSDVDLRDCTGCDAARRDRRVADVAAVDGSGGKVEARDRVGSKSARLDRAVRMVSRSSLDAMLRTFGLGSLKSLRCMATTSAIATPSRGWRFFFR
jgi:hypothetical protein